MPGQIVQTEQSDQGLHCLPFRLHRLDSFSMVEPHSSNFRVNTTFFGVSEYLGNLRYKTSIREWIMQTMMIT